jgi:ribosome-binding protein aMBF1 (putative translation factor)
MRQINDLVMKALKLANMNESVLADMLKVHRTTVGRWVNKKYVPNAEAILKLQKLIEGKK